MPSWGPPDHLVPPGSCPCPALACSSRPPPDIPEALSVLSLPPLSPRRLCPGVQASSLQWIVATMPILACTPALSRAASVSAALAQQGCHNEVSPLGPRVLPAARLLPATVPEASPAAPPSVSSEQVWELRTSTCTGSSATCARQPGLCRQPLDPTRPLPRPPQAPGLATWGLRLPAVTVPDSPAPCSGR